MILVFTENMEEPTVEKKAQEHYEKMKRETACKNPSPKIVKVNEVYPSPHKTYYPSCTVIHQCTEESGCCPEKRKCVPLVTQNVTLYFKVAVS